MINGKERKIRGTLTMVSADNLASNLMGGYKNLFSAYQKSQHCLANEEELQTVVCTYVYCVA